MLKRSSLVLALAVFAASAFGAGAQDSEKATVDEKIPAYEKVSGVSGNLASVGSDTMVNLMTLWKESFTRLYPSANLTIEGKGSATAPPALTAGTAQFGPMSRPMKAEEQEAFEKKFGAKPTEIAVALDALSVYVNKDNPIKSLTFEQLDGIFSKGAARDVATWGDLGLKGEWASRPISLYGRNSASGTYAFFKEHALAKHDYKDTVKEQPGSAAVINGVTEDIAGIGYSGIGYLTSGVKDVPLAAKAGDKPALPTYKNVLTKKYPLSRALYIYVAKVPGKPLDPAVKEFLKFVLSKQGQAVVIKEQYLPLTAKMVEAQLKKLE
jgi:phosphate transport system substrate-binding protein